MATRNKRATRVTSVTAHMPEAVELTKLNSGNSLMIEIRRNDLLVGKLVFGRGSVQWWPRGNSVNAPRRAWGSFADMLDDHM